MGVWQAGSEPRHRTHLLILALLMLEKQQEKQIANSDKAGQELIDKDHTQ